MESKYLGYCDVNDLYGWATAQMLPVGSFEGVEKNLSLMRISYKATIRIVIKDVFVDKYFYNNLPFLPKRMKIEKEIKLLAKSHDKNNFCKCTELKFYFFF